MLMLQWALHETVLFFRMQRTCFWEHLAGWLGDASDLRVWMRCPFGYICTHYFFNINRMRQCMKSWLQQTGWQNSHWFQYAWAFSFCVLVAMTFFFLLSMLKWTFQGKEKNKQTPRNLNCHLAIVPHGSWRNVTLWWSYALTVNSDPQRPLQEYA